MFSRFLSWEPTNTIGRQEWNTAALTELRTKLPQRFTPEYLQKAYAIQYYNALVDIISMVKHAGDEQNPLFTASERVERAFKTVTAGRTFTPEQMLDSTRGTAQDQKYSKRSKRRR